MRILGGLGVVLGKWGGGGPWWGSCCGYFYMAIFRVQGAPPPLEVGAFSCQLIHWCWLFWTHVSKKQNLTLYCYCQDLRAWKVEVQPHEHMPTIILLWSHHVYPQTCWY